MLKMIKLEKGLEERIAKNLRASIEEKIPIEDVLRIVKEVKEKGDRAVIFFEEKYDGAKLTCEDLRVREEEMIKAVKNISPRLLMSFKKAKQRLETAEKTFLKNFPTKVKVELDGVTIVYELKPVKRVGIYTPRSKISYPSSLIMSATPAQIAGVKSIAVATPPDSKGNVDEGVLAVCHILGIKEVYKIGGAQAIAALAYGTETVKPVEMIVGPGGRYVTAAKHIISANTSIEFLAGPTELLILADETANPKFVAYDLASQAEHGSDSIIILATNSEDLVNRVLKFMQSLDNGKHVIKQLKVVLGEIESLIKFSETFAPEHIQIMGDIVEKFSEKIEKAGLILIGEYTPTAASDYILGTNHVLPTYGLAAAKGGLSPLSFMKRVVKVKASRGGLLKLKDDGIRLATKENLYGHAKALEVRFS